MVNVRNVKLSAKTQQLWCVVIVVILAMVMEAAALNGPNVCMVKQKYNITKRVKYRAPMSVRTYEWCMAMPPRCSKWYTEMRDLTRLETEERTAEVAVCCPGYKMKDVACVPICPNGRTGRGCSEECPESKWGPNCVNDCQPCSDRGSCSPMTGKCSCQEGWQGESCESRMSSTTSTTTTTTAPVEELLTKTPATKPTPPITSTIPSTARTIFVETTPILKISKTSTTEITTSTTQATSLDTTTGASTFRMTTSTPKIILTQVVLSPKKSASLESASKSSEVALREDTTAATSLLTTPVTTTLAGLEVSTTNTLLTTHKILTTDTTSTKSRTKDISTQSTTEENRSPIETKQFKDFIDGNDRIMSTTTTERRYPTIVYNNVTITTHETTEPYKPLLQTTQRSTSNFIQNRTGPPYDTRKYIEEVPVEIKSTPIKILKINEHYSSAIPQAATSLSASHENQMFTTVHATTTTEETIKAETTKRPDATIRYFPTTVKFKPKEIWIRPAQKGELFAEIKKNNHDLHLRHRVAASKELSPNTTPKTIIVSIIPTSVSYATFKKIALTTASLLSQATNTTLKSNTNSTQQGITKPMLVLTSTLSPIGSKASSFGNVALENATNPNILKSVNSSKPSTHFYKVAKTLPVTHNAGTTWKNNTVSLNGTNSMTTVTQNLKSSNFITSTISSTNFIKTTSRPNVTIGVLKDATQYLERVTKHPFIKIVAATSRSVTIVNVPEKSNDTTIIPKPDVRVVEKTNATKTKDIANAKTNKITTESPDYEETFHILTEPEHITAVMEGKEKERTSVDLISVISIAGGVMMAVITVAVIIVMVERCRRPRYEDVRKMNDIHMQVMIDNNDVPPPYVRSIFHTPLPDPPTSEKCHYQPISTLDRNLKQFMRPVVVKTISPIMLENFREILECHYDHLPRRSHDFEVRHSTHCPISPSIDDVDERTHLRPCSITESTIDALKCEAKLDALDSTTSEPLYAEIPCWRPPSEHAIEIMNLNGEAVTEL